VSRPSHDTDKRLLAAGRTVLMEHGFGGLTLRGVAAKAKVNLGMFSYHFKGKDDFVRQVAQNLYDDFFRDFSVQVEGEKDPLEALRKGLVRLAFFVRDNQVLARSLAKDLMNGNPEAKRFAMANGPRHGQVLAALVQRCQKEKRLSEQPPGTAMVLLMSSVIFPVIMCEGAKAMVARLPFKTTKKKVELVMLGDESIRARVDLALKALA
jgi:AcrR family transcriptional regulator